MTASLFWILNMKMTLNIVGADASVRPHNQAIFLYYMKWENIIV